MNKLFVDIICSQEHHALTKTLFYNKILFSRNPLSGPVSSMQESLGLQR